MANAKVTVLAFYDNSQKFLGTAGKTFSIDTNSPVMGLKNLPTNPGIPGTIDYVPQTTYLKIKTIPFGELYLNMTIDQYNAAAAAAIASAGAPEITLTYTVDVDVPIGTTLTTSGLFNLVINSITVGHTSVDIRTIPYTSGAGVGTLDFTAIGGLTGSGTLVQIMGYVP